MEDKVKSSSVAQLPKMVGSIHIYGDGYGYGARCPTGRNIRTKPASVPKHRHPPDSARFLMGTTCTPLVTNDHKAQKRLADQMTLQTSGEYGKFLIDTDSKAVKLNCGKIPNQMMKPKKPETIAYIKETNDRYYSARLGTPMDLTYNRSTVSLYSSKPNLFASSNNFDSTSFNSGRRSDRSDRSGFSDLNSKPNSLQNTARGNTAPGNTGHNIHHNHNNSTSSYNNHQQSNTPSITLSNTGTSNNDNKMQFVSTLRSLDRQFDKQSRRDLFAASLPGASSQEQIYTVTGNHRSSQLSKVWTEQLRNTSN